MHAGHVSSSSSRHPSLIWQVGCLYRLKLVLANVSNLPQRFNVRGGAAGSASGSVRAVYKPGVVAPGVCAPLEELPLPVMVRARGQRARHATSLRAAAAAAAAAHTPPRCPVTTTPLPLPNMAGAHPRRRRVRRLPPLGRQEDAVRPERAAAAAAVDDAAGSGAHQDSRTEHDGRRWREEEVWGARDAWREARLLWRAAERRRGRSGAGVGGRKGAQRLRW